jgi:hypothetical protein
MVAAWLLALTSLSPVLSAIATPAAAAGAAGTIATVWGNGYVDGPALATPLPGVDRAGIAASGSTMYVTVYSAVYRVDLTTGTATLFAGPRFGDGTTDGPALGTSFTWLVDIEIEADGDVLLLERNTSGATSSSRARVWRISGGYATVVAGNTDVAAPPPTDHSVATDVRISGAEGIGVGPDGSVYIAGTQLYRVDATGDLTIVAGDGVANSTPGGDGGQARDAQFRQPSDVLVAGDGTIYLADGFLDWYLRKIDTSGVISTLTTFDRMGGMAFAPDGAIVVGGRGSHQVVRIALDGSQTVLAGNGGITFNGDGIPALSASLYVPEDVAYDGSGRLLIDTPWLNRVRAVNAGGTISTVFGGTAFPSVKEGAAPFTMATSATSLALDPSGRLVAGEPSPSRVQRLDTDGKVRTVAGNGYPGFVGDGGPGLYSRIGNGDKVAVTPNGAVYLADTDNSRIRKVQGNIITTVAGDGTADHLHTGPDPLAVTTLRPTAIAAGSDGSVYWAGAGDPGKVQHMHPNGSISLITYDPQAQGPYPVGFSLAVDRVGGLYVLQSTDLPPGPNNSGFGAKVVRVDPSGAITTVFGTNAVGFSGDGGPAALAQMSWNPTAIALGPDGSLFLTDTGNNRVRRITPDGIINTVAGTGVPGSFGEGGSATAASLDTPMGLAVDGAGRVYVSTASRIRVIEPALSWARPLGGPTDDDATDVRTLPDGGTVVVGRFTGTMVLGQIPSTSTLTSGGGTDGFVAVYEPTGRLRWAQRIWGPGTDDARSVAVDAAGNILVSGSIGTTATFGTGAATQSRNALADAYVAKYSSAGALAWVRTVTGTGAEVGAAVDVDATGNVWLAGTFSSASAAAGTTTLTNAGGIDGFVVRYSASGNLWFSAPVGGPGVDSLRAVATRPDGSAAVGGYFSSTAAVGRSGPSVTSGGGVDGLVAVFGQAGSVLWKGTISGPSTDWVSGVAVSAAGDVAVSGAFSGTASVGGTGPLVAVSGMDGVIARFAATGVPSWAVRFGGSGADNGVDIVTDGTQFLLAGVVSSSTSIGGTAIGGAGGYDGFTARLTDGAAAPPFTAVTPVAGGAGSGVAASIAARSGGFVVAGSFTGVASFGSAASTSLASAGTDGFVFLG